jgi:prepilin-type N-terminal cleavage/methylation domain-containing protein
MFMNASPSTRRPLSGEQGYSLIELMIAVAVLVVISGAMLDGVFKITQVSGTVNNRSEMHASVRNATELMQQEVGQAGRITLPNPITLVTPILTTGAKTVQLSSVEGIFINEQLVFDTGDREETVTVNDVLPLTKEITATFFEVHGADARVQVWGGFRTGVVPPSMANGSTGSTLKIYGDINDTGDMVYIEYWCDTAGGNLYRRSTPFDSDAKTALTPDLALINHVVPNPDGSACFTYDEDDANNEIYVINVAITLTVETATLDPTTRQRQRETKALLNVAPRNVFNTWQLANLKILNRVQPMPPTVAALLALP